MTQNLRTFNPKNCFLSSQKWVRDVGPGKNLDPGSRGKIKNCIPDPQHCFYLLALIYRCIWQNSRSAESEVVTSCFQLDTATK
jgi:hypothetical protein